MLQAERVVRQHLAKMSTKPIAFKYLECELCSMTGHILSAFNK